MGPDNSRITNSLATALLPAQILRLPQVCRMTGLGRSMIYQLEAERRFPCRVRIGARAVGWVESEVQGWLAARIQHYCRISVD
jgi:prophage regulatory protein